MSQNTDSIHPPAAALRVNRELSRWFDNTALAERQPDASLAEAHDRRIDWPRTVPFLLMHVA